FISSENEAVTFEPQAFELGPDMPPQEVIVRVDRTAFPTGDQSVQLFVQPFSEAFGMIEQTVQRELVFDVELAEPTPTLGPQANIVVLPSAPREGDILEITASGFESGETVLVEFVGPERSINDSLPVADAAGDFFYRIDLSTVPRGTYTLRLTGASSTATGQVEVLIAEALADAVVISDELNLRFGPDYNYGVLEVLANGDELTLIARNADESWLEVIDNTTGTQGWVVADLVQVNIDITTIPFNLILP
ncbi:MAG: SH3 domain-containing protein, partial [Chloroflexi bacterium]|nr:SH3 domain-containing protein [Chloroflexota bacterium]